MPIGLLNANELNAMIQSDHKSLAILDCTNGGQFKATFDEGHISSAKWLDLESFRDVTNPLPHMCPNREQLTKRCTELNVNETKTIICYDQQNGMWASRAAWVFWHWGFDNVHVLEGGLNGWKAAGYQLVNVSSCEMEKPLNMSGLATLNQRDVCAKFEEVHKVATGASSSF
jgi:3-mercaptopyruvate sulfurtransferase SseA